MERNHYKIFSPARIACLSIPNRLVRSATWDPSILASQQMSNEVLDLYRNLALGGVGMIISGGLPVYREKFPDEETDQAEYGYADLRVNNIEEMARVVHQARPDCVIVAQLEVGYTNTAPSAIPSPFSAQPPRALVIDEIEQLIDCFVLAIVDMQECGFNGVQLHAAHGGLLSRFLSPYTNQRQDSFGGSPGNRSKIIQEIISRVRKVVGDFPILIKINCTDYLPGGIDYLNFPDLAQEIARCGVDAIELSGGMWECLLRPEQELGFRPVPAPESHTRIRKSEQQSYFLQYAEQLDLPVPVILGGGNRHIERLEAILQSNTVDFIALCRPFIRQPDLPNRWRAGIGSHLPDCVSCNSCLYAMYVHPGKPQPGVVECICKADRKQHQQAQKWLTTWRNEIVGG